MPFWDSGTSKKIRYLFLPRLRWLAAVVSLCEHLLTYIQFPTSLRTDLGLLLNVKMSNLCATQRILFLGFGTRFSNRKCFPCRGKISEDRVICFRHSSVSNPEINFLFRTDGPHGNDYLCHSICTSQNEANETLVGSDLQTKPGQCSHASYHATEHSRLFDMIDKQSQWSVFWREFCSVLPCGWSW